MEFKKLFGSNVSFINFRSINQLLVSFTLYKNNEISIILAKNIKNQN